MSVHHPMVGNTIVASLMLAFAATSVIACGAAGPHVSGNAPYVSRELLPIDQNAAAYDNLYDAIEHLRPEYLRVREQGSTSMVPVAYLNGVRLADPSLLRIVPVSWVLDVRWVRPNETSALYRASHQLGGGIFVRTKEGGAR